MTTRRKDALGVHSIDHFALDVPDLAVARSFYEDFGLDVRDEDGGLALYCQNNPHRWATIRQNDGPKRLRYLSFGLYAEDEAAFAAHLANCALTSIAAVEGGENSGFWFAGPDGLPINVRVAAKASPSAKTRFGSLSTGPGECGAIPNSQAPRVRPRTLSHFAIFTTDVMSNIGWYENVLGLRLSDSSAPAVAFLHGPHGSDHHMLALVLSDHRGMHHASWDVGSVHEVGLGGRHMENMGYGPNWGLGRHVLGGNYFFYVRDPWGSFSEYSADIDFVPHDHEWPAANHAPEDSMFLWGPNPPESFIDNCEPA